MIVLDTNVLSELMKPQGSKLITAWADSQSRNSLFTTAVTQSEIIYGIAILPEGSRKQRLHDTAQAFFKGAFSRKILPFEQNAAEHFALLHSTVILWRSRIDQRVEAIQQRLEEASE